MDKPNDKFKSPFFRPNADQMAAMPASQGWNWKKTAKGIVAGLYIIMLEL